MHKIPNFRFAFWGQRHMIHIVFPALYSESRRGSQLSREEKTAFYARGLRPTIDELIPHDASDWPATFDTELFRAQKKTGAFSYQTKMIAHWNLSPLVDTLREKLEDEDIKWAQGFFFIHTIRGTKHSTQHSKDQESAQLALQEFLLEADIPTSAISEGEWWIDVGVEINSLDSMCLQWRTSSHFHIAREVLVIPSEHASRITSITSSKYSKDLVSHLAGVSGCRIEPGVQAEGRFEAKYFQMYTTDKAITYHPDGITHGKSIKIEQAMGVEQPPKFIEGLLDVYSNAVEKNFSNARVEVRVPLRHATTALIRLSEEVVREALLAFSPEEWW